MLLFVVLAATTLVLFTPKILWSFAPHAVSAVPQDRVASEFYWRLRFYIKKATGGVPDLSWAEVVKGTWPGRQLKGTWPGSGFITGKVITEGRSLSAAVVNPLDRPEDHAKGKELFLKNCAACHVTAGRPRPSLAKSNYQVGASDLALYKRCGTAFPARPWPVSTSRSSSAGSWSGSCAHSTRGPRAGRDRWADPVDVSWQALLTARSRTDEWLTCSGAWTAGAIPAARDHAGQRVRAEVALAHQFASEDAIQATPIVANGTIFISEPPSNVVALEAATGREIWRYMRRLPDKLRSVAPV